MRFTIIREEFLKSLLISSRAVNSKIIANPVLANLKIELNESGLFITGSNHELIIRSSIPYSKEDKEIIRNYKEGAVLVNAKILTDYVGKMEGEEVTLDVIDSTIAVVSDNKSNCKLNCVKAEEYPDLDLEENGVKISLSKADFSKMVSQTAFAASFKEQRPVLTALNLEASNGLLTATATDSARLARKQIAIPEGINFVSNIPAKTIVEVDHLIENSNVVNIDFSNKKALFTFDNILVSTILVAGDYPNTKNVVPKATNYKLQVNASEFTKAVGRANVLSADKENVVTLKMEDNNIEISSKSSQIGSGVEKIEEFNYSGINLQISFNSNFIVAAIQALDCEDVVFEFVGEMKPFVIKNPNDDSVIQIVTPIRTY